MRRISLGGGFRYLMDSVAVGDGAAKRPESLAAYYAATGTPPGVFLGSGLGALADGKGVEKGSVVTEQHLFNMLGLCCDPVTGEQLGRSPNLGSKLAPVAGFDLTFSPSKSVSVAWALADDETRQVIFDCHREAVEFVVSYAEREVFHSRSGTNGIVTEDIEGVIATAFTHFDSRAGDAQLHTHLVVWNRARSPSDGRWRTVDSWAIFQARSSLSSMHQGVLSDLLTERLGWVGRHESAVTAKVRASRSPVCPRASWLSSHSASSRSSTRRTSSSRPSWPGTGDARAASRYCACASRPPSPPGPPRHIGASRR